MDTIKDALFWDFKSRIANCLDNHADDSCYRTAITKWGDETRNFTPELAREYAKVIQDLDLNRSHVYSYTWRQINEQIASYIKEHFISSRKATLIADNLIEADTISLNTLFAFDHQEDEIVFHKQNWLQEFSANNLEHISPEALATFRWTSISLTGLWPLDEQTALNISNMATLYWKKFSPENEEIIRRAERKKTNETAQIPVTPTKSQNPLFLYLTLRGLY